MIPTGADAAATAALTGLADAALRACAIGCVAALALVLLRVTRAGVRLCVWTIVLGAAILMPALAWVSPPLRWSVPIAVTLDRWSPSIASASAPLRTAAASSAPAIRAPASPETSTTPSARPSAAAGPARAPDRRGFSWPVVAAAIYLLGVAFFLLRMITGAVMTLRLGRHALPVRDEALSARLRAHAAVAGLAPSRDIGLAETPGLYVPMTMGVVHPVVLLPHDWREWIAAKLDAVLAHEMAHVARRDALTQRLSLCYRAVFWFSPFSWWLHRRLVELAEQASDDAVLATGADRVAYAEILLEFFEAIGREPRRVEWRIAMASGVSAERRVDRILAWKGGRAMKLTRSVVLAVVLAAVPVVVVTASVHPVLLPAESLTLPSPPHGVAPFMGPLTLAALSTASSPTMRLPIAPVPQTTQAAGGVMAPAPQPRAQELDADKQAQTQPSAMQTLTGPNPFVRLQEPLTGFREIAMVFDLRMLPGTDRQRVIDTASQYIDRTMTPADWVSVSTFGATLQTVQDFTADKVTLHAALVKVATMAGGTAMNDARLKALRAACGELGRAQQETVTRFGLGMSRVNNVLEQIAVLYFSSGVMRGLEAAFELPEVADACTKTNVLFYTIDASGMSALSEPAPGNYAPGDALVDAQRMLDIGIIDQTSARALARILAIPRNSGASVPVTVAHQASSPVTLLDPSPTLDLQSSAVTLRNDASTVIRSVTVAVLVRVDAAAPQVFTYQESFSSFEPGRKVRIATRLIGFATLVTLAQQGATAELGVVEVEFTDGSKWTYDLKAKGRFGIGRE